MKCHWALVLLHFDWSVRNSTDISSCKRKTAMIMHKTHFHISMLLNINASHKHQTEGRKPQSSAKYNIVSIDNRRQPVKKATRLLSWNLGKLARRHKNGHIPMNTSHRAPTWMSNNFPQTRRWLQTRSRDCRNCSGHWEPEQISNEIWSYFHPWRYLAGILCLCEHCTAPYPKSSMSRSRWIPSSQNEWKEPLCASSIFNIRSAKFS